MDDTPHGLSMGQISRSIGLSRILLIIGLVFLHYGNFPNSKATPFEGIDVNEHSFVTWLNSTILFFFFSAVPLLSMISGWLFFSFITEDAWPSIFRRMRRRFTSLYLPLVAWNIAYLLVIYAAFRLNPHSSAFSHASRINIDINSAGWKEYMNSVFAITGEPLAFQFWFVRDLFVTALISPVMWMIIRHTPWLGAMVMCIIWLSGWDMFIFTDRFDVPFFFYLGALIKQKHITLTITLRLTIAMVLFFLVLAGLRALAPYIVDFSEHVYPVWLNVAMRIMRIFGVIGFWGIIYRYAQTKSGSQISN